MNHHLLNFVLIIQIFTVFKNAFSAEFIIPDFPSSSGKGFYTIQYNPLNNNLVNEILLNSSDIRPPLRISNVLPLTTYNVTLRLWNNGQDFLDEEAVKHYELKSGPDPPENISVIAQENSIFVNWTNKENDAQFHVIIDEDDKRSVDRNITENFVDVSIGSSTGYNISIAVLNNDMLSPYATRHIKLGLLPPSNIYEIDEKTNETTITVEWVDENQRPVMHYNIFISSESGFMDNKTVFATTSASQATFDNLQPGTFYIISVHCCNEDNCSAPLSYNATTVPLPPSNLSVKPESVTNNSFLITWESPELYGDGFEVSVSDQAESILIPENHFYEVVGVYPGSTTLVTVRSKKGEKFSEPVEKEFTTTPYPVTDLTAKWSTQSSIEVQWQTSPSSIQDEFEIQYQRLPFENEGNSLKTNKTSCNILDVNSDSDYHIEVTAISKEQRSSVSLTIIDKRKDDKKAINVEPYFNISAINIEMQNVYSDQEVFVQCRRLDTDEVLNSSGKGPIMKIGNLYGGTNYSITVLTGKENQTVVIFIYPTPPESIFIDEESVDTMSMTVSWSNPLNSFVDSYNVNYSCQSQPWKIIKNIKEHYVVLNNLTSACVYQIYVYSVSSNIEGKIAAKIEQPTRPWPPSNITITCTKDTANITWIAPNGNISQYVVNYSSLNISKKKKVISEPVLITNLVPATMYKYGIVSYANNLSSVEEFYEKRTYPKVDIFTNIIVFNDSFSLTYSKAVNNYGEVLYYFELEGSGKIINRNLSEKNKPVTFTNLTPGKSYRVLISCMIDNLFSEKAVKEVQLLPSPVIVELFNATSHSAYLKWRKPNEPFTYYSVTCNASIYITIPDSVTEYSCNGLTPFTNNSMGIYVVLIVNSEIYKSSEFLQRFTTEEDAPGNVSTFITTGVIPYLANFSWSEPMEKNGILLDYTFMYKEEKDEFINLSLPITYRSLTVENLIANHTYIFQIYARTKNGNGTVSTLIRKTPVWAPPRPNETANFVKSTKKSLTIEFSKTLFSSMNGEIQKYIVIVAEAVLDDSNSATLSKWSKVQGQDPWPPYQTSPAFNPFKQLNKIQYVIGSEKCTDADTYCNGPLKPGIKYSVKIRAFTDDISYTDTFYSQFSTDPDYTILIISVVVPVIVILILIIVLSVMRRRKVGPFVKKAKEVPRNSREEKISITDSLSDKSRPVKIVDFPTHFNVMSADSDFRFSEEYEDLKHVGRDQPATAADLPVNRPKNRFTNILPYDHSRVKLLPTDDEEGSDYINANYMPGYRSPREFIVTQGALHSTRDDMWRMVWEQNCRAIVMLTRCVEKGREKCDHYWPYDMEPVYYGDLQVTIMNESQFQDWTITEFKVSLGDQARIVRHFHFTAWPDFGVPERPQTLIKFVRAFRERVSTDTKPIVVHCSAGVGRSGTFIVLDRLLQQIEVQEYVDIFGIVYEMRKERVWMVQTEQQYVCIHQCLLCVIEKREDEPSLHPEAHENQGYDDDEGIAESGM